MIIKNNYIVETAFKAGDHVSVSNLMSGNFVFLKYWYFPYLKNNNVYSISKIPGGKKGISASTIGGYNIGINKYIDDEKKKAAKIVYQFITSKDIQKKIVMNNSIISGIVGLYDDQEVCNITDCEFYKSLQFIARPREINYNSYSKKFRKYIFDYLYGNETNVYNTLKKVDDISKIYSVSMGVKDSPVGLIIFLVIILISLIYLSSLVFLFIDRYRKHFQFFSKDLWAMIMTGVFIVLYVSFFEFGEPTAYICSLKISTFSFGTSLIVIPLLYVLLENFPTESKKVEWILNNKYKFISILFGIEFLLLSLTYISPYETKTVFIEDGENFKKCYLNGTFSTISNYSLLGALCITVLSILFLIFLEWNIQLTRNDIRQITYSIYVDFFVVVAFYILYYFDFQLYTVRFLVRSILFIFISITSYLFLYGFRIIKIFIEKNIEDKEFEEEFKKMKENEENRNSILQTNTYTSKNSNSSLANNTDNKILNSYNNKVMDDNTSSKRNSECEFETVSYSDSVKGLIPK